MSEKYKGISEAGWDQLFEQIKEGNVVPIIGEELLKIKVGDKTIPLYDFIIQKLADKLEVDYSENNNFTKLSTGANISKWKELRTNIYIETAKILEENSFELPVHLKKLFEIKEFKLILSTTFDNLGYRTLEESIDKENIDSVYYEKGKIKDITITGKTILYQMFGKAKKSTRSFVLNEDDLIDYLHQWMNDNYAPINLMNNLKQKYLLVIGCNYPNWLFRFFLHSIQSPNLSPASTFEENKEYIAGYNTDEELTSFLFRVGAYYEDDIEKFIDELMERYRALEDKKIIKNEVFLSYASEDINSAKKIKERFDKENIGVWFDKDDLEDGDIFDEKIKSNIKSSKIFVPVLSKNVLTKQGRYFKKEWSLGVDVAREHFGQRFIFPIIIDDVDIKDELIPEALSSLHMVNLNSEAFEKTFKKMLRKIRAI